MISTSPKSILEKMHLKPGQAMAIVNAPAGYESLLVPLPHGCHIERRMDPRASVVQVFVHNMAELEGHLSEIKGQLGANSALWVSYPKGTSGIETDLNRDIIWKYARTIGMDAVSNFSVDEVWSALRLKVVPGSR